MDLLRQNVSDLLHKPAARRVVTVDVPAEELGGIGQTRLAADEPIHIEISLEHVADSIVVNGTATAVYEGECARCLEPVRHTVATPVRELFEPEPIEGQTYALEGEDVDLGGPLRDNLLLELPPTVLCREECAGLCPACGANRNDGECGCDLTVTDPRWDALRDLKIT
jgi:uncharacterized protein